MVDEETGLTEPVAEEPTHDISEEGASEEKDSGTGTEETGEKETEEPKTYISVEDGTGLTDSNSYVSVDFADAYFSARGVSSWALLETVAKEQSLIRATDYVDSIFQWNGKKLASEQALRFPRAGLVDYEGNDVEGIPNCLKQAVCDAALLISEGTELFQTKEANGDVVSEKIGELSFTYSKTSKETVAGSSLYDSINTKLRGLFKDTSKNRIIISKVERV